MLIRFDSKYKKTILNLNVRHQAKKMKQEKFTSINKKNQAKHNG